MEFTFPDSGRKIKLEGLSFLTLSLLRGSYDAHYAGKPVEPVDPLEETKNGDVSSPEFKAKYEEYKTAKTKYDQDLALWQIRVNQAKWLAVKMLYAGAIDPASIDTDAVEKAVAKAKLVGLDLPQAIRDTYAEFNVPFQEELLTPYLYLFHVCISTSGDQLLFEDALMQGSGPTQEAVREATFRLRSKI